VAAPGADRAALHQDKLRERIRSFEVQLNDDPAAVQQRLRPKTRLEPQEEKLRV
jgi:hypothetical protein